MNTIPFVSLKNIVPDTELVRLLPSKFAYYHLALPLAADDGAITLAMAHPDNPIVIEMLAEILGATIVPVFADAAEIKSALDQVWTLVEARDPKILAWGSSGQHALQAYQCAKLLSPLLGTQVDDFQGNDMEHVLMLTQQDHYTLTVIGGASTENFSTLVRKAGTPILFLLGDSASRLTPTFTRILLSLRGHAPDLSALHLAIPLASQHRAEMTVLAVTPNSVPGRLSLGLTAFLDPDQDAAQHLTHCTDMLTEAGITGYVKLCQGNPVQQIVTEYTKGQYSLLVITSEAFGDFVQQVMEALQLQTDRMAVLVVRPGLPG